MSEEVGLAEVSASVATAITAEAFKVVEVAMLEEDDDGLSVTDAVIDDDGLEDPTRACCVAAVYLEEMAVVVRVVGAVEVAVDATTDATEAVVGEDVPMADAEPVIATPH